VRPVQRDLLTALAGQLLLLAVLASAAGLGTTGWTVGLTLAVAGDLVLATAYARAGRSALSPARAAAARPVRRPGSARASTWRSTPS